MRSLLTSILLLVVGMTSPAMCRPVSFCIASLMASESQCQDAGTCEGCQPSSDNLVCCVSFDALPDGEPPAPAAHTPVPVFYLLAEIDPDNVTINTPASETLPRDTALRAPPPGAQHRAVLEIWNL